jgi:class 3 adenylate cyclase
MQVSRSLQQLLIKALSQSMDVRTMVKITRKLFRNYNIYERTGWPESIPMQSFHAAKQITADLMKDESLFFKFITVLIDVYQNGLMGSKINIKYLPQIMNELDAMGLTYNPEYGTFIESKGDNMSKGWRVLEEGKQYEFCLLRIDIVENSRLVREYSSEVVTAAYSDFRNSVRSIVEKRNGRLWGWEGDGGIAAFYFKEKNIDAVLSGIEILLELFFYNIFRCPLQENLKVRIAIHTGQCQFFHDLKRIQNDTVRILESLEAEYTLPDTITLTPSVYHDLGNKLEKYFLPIEIRRGHYVYRYQLHWENIPAGK